MIKFILDILSDPAILIGIFALLGLLLQRAKVSDVVAGTIKTILGFVILAPAHRFWLARLISSARSLTTPLALKAPSPITKPSWRCR